MAPQQPAEAYLKDGSESPSQPSPDQDKWENAQDTQSKRRYQCRYCDKRFSRPSSLTTHVYTHTGEKPFVCSTHGCGRAFSVLSNLRRHMRICQKNIKKKVHLQTLTPRGEASQYYPPIAPYMSSYYAYPYHPGVVLHPGMPAPYPPQPGYAATATPAPQNHGASGPQAYPSHPSVLPMHPVPVYSIPMNAVPSPLRPAEEQHGMPHPHPVVAAVSYPPQPVYGPANYGTGAPYAMYHAPVEAAPVPYPPYDYRHHPYAPPTTAESSRYVSVQVPPTQMAAYAPSVTLAVPNQTSSVVPPTQTAVCMASSPAVSVKSVSATLPQHPREHPAEAPHYVPVSNVSPAMPHMAPLPPPHVVAPPEYHYRPGGYPPPPYLPAAGHWPAGTARTIRIAPSFAPALDHHYARRSFPSPYQAPVPVPVTHMKLNRMHEKMPANALRRTSSADHRPDASSAAGKPHRHEDKPLARRNSLSAIDHAGYESNGSDDQSNSPRRDTFHSRSPTVYPPTEYEESAMLLDQSSAYDPKERDDSAESKLGRDSGLGDSPASCRQSSADSRGSSS